MERNEHDTREDLASLIPELDGEPLVYVRPVDVEEVMAEVGEDEMQASGLALDPDGTLYAVHLQNGRRMAVFSDRNLAFVTARAHGAEPVSVH